jgi:hypothetical protein
MIVRRGWVIICKLGEMKNNGSMYFTQGGSRDMQLYLGAIK